MSATMKLKHRKTLTSLEKISGSATEDDYKSPCLRTVLCLLFFVCLWKLMV
ncbi:hypothetical protein HanXRQr2_Chr02g0050041 [Helianthus annuus]|uniref:Uncharacterized protein n=1 Tax=Helianthus annuus TaxID=4232 RepID=A0A251VDT7_HELAN|nr:hypothetical protein HanXRQr2_Chr02g0050041 [Helianthus annuus]KAJ0950543.1 hypothetical protein HanPSC8_Chr02g0049461 [Helianthus annuus]